MDFDFDDDQRLLQRTLRDFLASECPAARLRALWEEETGRSRALWRQLGEFGVPGLLVPEEHGGLGQDETDAVLVWEEVGRAALAEPVVATAAVAAPLLRELPDPAPGRAWLPRIAAGDAIAVVASELSPLVADAHVADLLLLAHAGEIHALEADGVRLEPQPADDPSERLFAVAWEPRPATRVAQGEAARAALAAALDRGALACAAQSLGVAERLVELSAAYAGQRVQFGAPIGSFQAVKHQLANAVVALEYARGLVYRAAHSVARGGPCRSADVSMAKARAGEAARLCARTALQVHGAIGYTWEQDLHVWMRRAWSLDLAWGEGAWHRRRVADAVVDGAAPAESFGYVAPAA